MRKKSEINYLKGRIAELEQIILRCGAKLPDLPLETLGANIAISLVQKTVCEVCDIEIGLITKERFRGAEQISDARMLSMSLCERYVLASQDFIAKKHGRKDHAVVIHARMAMKNRCDADPLRFGKIHELCVKLLDVRLNKTAWYYEI